MNTSQQSGPDNFGPRSSMSVGQFSSSPPPPAPITSGLCRPLRPMKSAPSERPSNADGGSPRLHHPFNGNGGIARSSPSGSVLRPAISTSAPSSASSQPATSNCHFPVAAGNRRMMMPMQSGGVAVASPQACVESKASQQSMASAQCRTSTLDLIPAQHLASVEGPGSYNGHYYIWLDENGRPTSPPKLHYDDLGNPGRNNSLRRVNFDLGSNDNLGLMIRGGIEYGLGIFITGVEPQSAAHRHGLRLGDEILEGNGRAFHRLTHDEAVRILKCSQTFDLVVRHIGKVPHSTSMSSTDTCDLMASVGQDVGPTNGRNHHQVVQPSSAPTGHMSNSRTSPPNRLGQTVSVPPGVRLIGPPPTTSTRCIRGSSSSSSPPSTSSCGHQVLSDSRMLLLEPHHKQQQQQQQQQQQPMFVFDSGLRARSNSTPLVNGNGRLSSSTGSAGRHPFAQPRLTFSSQLHRFRSDLAANESNNKNRSTSGESPELSMILDKAQVLLSRDEFATLSLLLADYEAADISVDLFAAGLLNLIADAEKTSFFTEIREIVRPEDLPRFDCLIYQRGNLLDKLLRGSGSGGRSKVVGSYDDDDQDEEDTEWILLNDRDEEDDLINEDSQNDEDLSGSEERLERLFLRDNLRNNYNGPLSDTDDPMDRNVAQSMRRLNYTERGRSRIVLGSGAEDGVDLISKDRRRGRLKRVMLPPSLPPQSSALNSSNQKQDFRNRISGLVDLQRESAFQVDDSGSIIQLQETGYRTSEQELQEMPARLPDPPPSHIRIGRQTIHVPKCSSTLGIAIEGGVNTKQPLPRIISIQPNGAAFQAGGLRIGQLIREVDGISLEGLPHDGVARLIAECFAKRNRPVLTLVVQDQIRTPAEMRRSCMLPQ